MNFHSKVKPYDIFYSKKANHYYICVYTQKRDHHNNLLNDIYGIIITTNPKYQKLIEEERNDYNVEVEIKNKKAYVCCDKLSRFDDCEDVILKNFKLKDTEVEKIKENFSKFINELKRQTKIEE